MFFSTSDNYDQSHILENYGMVDSTVVIGANIFRDVFASFRDLVGGETKGYKKDLEKLKNAVQVEIALKAEKFGANAIIALKMDMDEISGGGKSMFMYQLVGTAVKLKEGIIPNQNLNDSADIRKEDFIELRTRVARRNKVLNNPGSLREFASVDSNDWWDVDLYKHFVFQYFNKDEEVAERYLALIESVPPKYFIHEFRKQISSISGTTFHYCIQSMEKHNWFDTSIILELLKSKSHVARFRTLHIIYNDRLSYSIEEIDDYASILNYLKTEFDTTVKSEKSNTVFGSKEVCLCASCLENRPIDENKVCSNCNANIFGFIDNNTGVIDLKKLINKLSSTINTLQYLKKDEVFRYT